MYYPMNFPIQPYHDTLMKVENTVTYSFSFTMDLFITKKLTLLASFPLFQLLW